jgi:hypothetical protein
MKTIAKGLLVSAAMLSLAACQKPAEEAAPASDAATEAAASADAASDAATDAATDAAPATEALDDTNNPIGPGKQ